MMFFQCNFSETNAFYFVEMLKAWLETRNRSAICKAGLVSASGAKNLSCIVKSKLTLHHFTVYCVMHLVPVPTSDLRGCRRS